MGGAFAIDQTVEVNGGEVRVVDEHGERDAGRLGHDAQADLERLASSARSATVATASGSVYDAMVTQIEIGEGADATALTMRTGDAATPEVYELVELVLRAARQDLPGSG